MVSLVAIAVRRVRVPYTVALVVVGLLITSQQPLELAYTPELFLALLLPPLLFEAAFHLEVDRLREILVPLLALAVPGVLLTTMLVALVVAHGALLPLSAALVFGALIAATDPVAVVAVFRALGAPKALQTLVEGESLFNDGTAVVLLRVMLAAALGAAVTPAAGWDLTAIAVDFVWVAAGGLAIGAALGLLFSVFIARLDDYLIETTLTTVLAFGAYLVGERLHVSGVLAVVAAGLVAGNVGLKGMSPTTRVVLFNFWEFAAFIANSLVFLLIGLQVNVSLLAANLWPITVAIAAVMASRVVTVYGLTWLVGLRGPRLPMAYRHVLFWSGLRGALGLALALSLPRAVPGRDLIQVMAFGVTLFTLLVQGTTVQQLLRRLGFIQPTAAKLEYERRHGRLIAAQAARDHLHALYRSGTLSATTWEQLAPEVDQQVSRFQAAQRTLLAEHPGLHTEELEDARREGLQAQRASLAGLARDGVISEAIAQELITEVDAALEGLTGEAGATAVEPPR